MLIEVSRELRPVTGTVQLSEVLGTSAEKWWSVAAENVSLFPFPLERNLLEGRPFCLIYVQNLKTCKKLWKYLHFGFCKSLVIIVPRIGKLRKRRYSRLGPCRWITVPLVGSTRGQTISSEYKSRMFLCCNHSVLICPKGMLQLPKQESLLVALEDLLVTRAYVHRGNMSYIKMG